MWSFCLKAVYLNIISNNPSAVWLMEVQLNLSHYLMEKDFALLYTKQMCHLLVCPHKIYVVSRLSRGWGDCGGNCTRFGSMLEVYMPESTSSRGPGLCLAKLQRMSMNPGEQSMRDRRGMRRMTRCSLNSVPAFKFWNYIWDYVGLPLFILFSKI